MGLGPALALLLLLLACSPTPDGETRAAGDGTIASDTVEGGEVFSHRVAVFLLADSARMEAIRAGYDEESFYIVADDMMWYRAEAWSWLEERGIPIVSLDGRVPLRFRVDGRTRTYDFSAEPTADLVILYEPDREPLALAAIDLAGEAPEYFSGAAP